MRDKCASGMVGWRSNANTDFDGDGCQDGGEDNDDDGDGVSNPWDICPHTRLKAAVDKEGCSKPQVRNKFVGKTKFKLAGSLLVRVGTTCRRGWCQHVLVPALEETVSCAFPTPPPPHFIPL